MQKLAVAEPISSSVCFLRSIAMLSKVAVLLATLLCILYIANVASASRTFDAFRLIQMKTKSGTIGSLHAPISGPAATLSAAKLHRHALLIRAEELCQESVLSRLTSIMNNTRIEGILIVLPDPSRPLAAACEGSGWATVENFLVTRRLALPVYFVHDSDVVESVMDDVTSTQGSDSDKYHLTVSLSDASQLRDPRLVNLQAALSSAADARETIVVTAHYDAFSIAPGMPVSGGSGATALLYVARLLGSLSETRAALPQYRVVFVLAAAGHENHHGLQHWATQAADTKMLDAVSFTLCLDDLAGNTLNAIAAKQPNEDRSSGSSMFSELERAAALLHVPFSTHVHKMNLTDRFVAWPHERLARRKVAAATLSSRTESLAPYTAESLISQPASAAFVLRNARVVAEALGRLMYGLTDSTGLLFGELPTEVDNNSDATFVDAWLAAFARTPRVAPFIASDAPLLSSLEHTLKQHSNSVFRQSFVLPQVDVAFFGSERGEVTLVRAKPALFDVLLLVPITLYLVALTVLLLGPSQALAAARGFIGTRSS